MFYIPLRKFFWIGILFYAFSASAHPLRIVAAENFYGYLAKQLGGPYIEVSSFLSNTIQDPHLFNYNPLLAKKAEQADIIIYNGLDYDPWMQRLLALHTHDLPLTVINVSLLTQEKQNPHIWYDPHTLWLFAQYLTQLLIQKDPMHKKEYSKNLKTFQTKYQVLNKKIQAFKNQYQRTAITATEPIFNLMAEKLGLIVKGVSFQWHIMNATEPSIAEIKNFEELLEQHKVKALINNAQSYHSLIEHMQDIAKHHHIPIVIITEMQPVGKDYIDWMCEQIDALEKAFIL